MIKARTGTITITKEPSSVLQDGSMSLEALGRGAMLLKRKRKGYATKVTRIRPQSNSSTVGLL